jgi:hypothetical protein
MRNWLRKCAFGGGLAMVLSALSLQPGLAWTENFTSFDYDGNPYCGQVSAYNPSTHRGPCLFWQEPHNTSITIQAYLNPALNLGYYDFNPAVTRAFTDINAVPNWGPYMSACYTNNCAANAPGNYSTGSQPCYVYGTTTYSGLSASEYTTTNGIGWYQFEQYIPVVFNSYASGWNNNLYYATYMNCDFAADGRKVATHESGHVQGLGHTLNTAVMHQGPEAFYALQSDDVAGLKAIYPGNQPSS